ncbi:MAG: hypothetical protein ACYCRF_12715, partial [Acidithiobacillus sp.]
MPEKVVPMTPAVPDHQALPRATTTRCFARMGYPSILEKENIMDEQRSKALSAALSQIDKQFGKGAVMRLG